MADPYWRYGDTRQQPPSAAAAALSHHALKRPRSDYELPSGHEMPSYYAREDDRTGLRAIRDTDTINASYDRYLRTTQLPSYGSDSGRSLSSGLGGHHPIDDPRVLPIGGSDPALAAKARPIAMGGRPEVPLPPDASSTLFVEGLPANCSRREVSHIFRPFVGYKEVRLVTKESRRPGGDPLVLCFVDFQTPAHAATAMDALQGMLMKRQWDCWYNRCSNIYGFSIVVRSDDCWHHKIVKLNLAGYKFDEHDRDSAHLRLQFSRFPGARSGGGHRGKR